MTEQWVCVFTGRAGAHARAVFHDREAARAFAERHAQVVVPDGIPLKWEDRNEATSSSTPVGDYLIAMDRGKD